jgi:hypothetical protein
VFLSVSVYILNGSTKGFPLISEVIKPQFLENFYNFMKLVVVVNPDLKEICNLKP